VHVVINITIPVRCDRPAGAAMKFSKSLIRGVNKLFTISDDLIM
jgi:hypothetical protein